MYYVIIKKKKKNVSYQCQNIASTHALSNRSEKIQT